MAKVTVHTETPSESIVKNASKTNTITDSRGRLIVVKKLLPSDRMRLFELAGGENVKNEQYMGYAALAFIAVSIDGEILPRISTRHHLDALLDRLGDEGIDAIGEHLQQQANEQTNDDKASLKNG